MSWVEAEFYEKANDGVQCTLCPHECRLNDGDTGKCHVRKAFGRTLRTATFSPVVQHLDSVERKPLYHYRPGSKLLTLAAPGCSFRCLYCQNYRLSQIGPSASDENGNPGADIGDLVRQASSQNAGIAFSYSEPSLACEFSMALANAGRTHGVEVAWKTNGFMTRSAAELVASHLSAVNLDLKSPDDSIHRKLTGAALQPVLDTLDVLLDAGVWVEISTPLIPGLNDDDQSIRLLADLILRRKKSIPWHLLRFIPEYRLAHLSPTQPSRLERAREIGRSAGLQFVYVERALGEAGRTTHCPKCNVAVIERDIWATRKSHLTESNCCPSCHYPIPGNWSRNHPCPPNTDSSELYPTSSTPRITREIPMDA